MPLLFRSLISVDVPSPAPCASRQRQRRSIDAPNSGVVGGSGAADDAFPLAPPSPMSDDATLLRSHLHDSPHLDEEV